MKSKILYKTVLPLLLVVDAVTILEFLIPNKIIYFLNAINIDFDHRDDDVVIIVTTVLSLILIVLSFIFYDKSASTRRNRGFFLILIFSVLIHSPIVIFMVIELWSFGETRSY
ncbi:MAG: D-alanyl-lipoteichoic acid acyltransferase DltB (MBOAT superfamily) [Saprospiraceae bacterium]|jgi:D-alanyl-lipoteichoic acid acyltransferase DltB (MBOAT superfamily)